MKVAPIMDVLSRREDVETFLIHTGQHYDERMSRLFFDELGIAQPDVNLEVGSGSHAVQTAEIMKRIEAVCVAYQPDWVIVVGDVNGTMAAALVASKLGLKVAHVEAGLRSFDRAMPEEINRLVTDVLSDMLFVTEPSGVENLRREGAAEEKIHFVGNVMVDTLLRHRSCADKSGILANLNVERRQYALVTLHRPSNVDDATTFSAILDALEEISRDQAVVFPIHPRSRLNLEKLGLARRVEGLSRVHMIDPLGYLDFLKLMAESAIVLTDSGGIQEETTVLGVPCLTLRENTERPITLTKGTNRLTGSQTTAVLSAYRDVRDHPPGAGTVPELWDGRAAERIVELLIPRR